MFNWNWKTLFGSETEVEGPWLPCTPLVATPLDNLLTKFNEFISKKLQLS